MSHAGTVFCLLIMSVSPFNYTSRRNRRKKVGNSNKVVRLTDIGRFCPDRTFCRLRWNDTTLARSAASGSNAMNWYIRSSAFDPDPAVLTGGIPGFVELANLYEYYKVHKMKVTYKVCNQELNAISFSCWPSNVGVNANSLTADDVMEYWGNVGAKPQMMSKDSGYSYLQGSSTADGLSLVGPIFNTDLDYSSNTSTNPALMFYLNFAAITHVGNFNFPMPVQISVVYDIEFFGRRVLEI